MTNTRIRRSWILVVLLGAFTTATGQYQNKLAELTASINSEPPEEATIKSYTDLFNPLGPKAQLMRIKSYSCIDEPPSISEKGLWIKLGKTFFRYEGKKVLRLDEHDKLVKVNYEDYNIALKKTVMILNSLEKRSDYARNIIRTLQSSDNKFTISLAHTRECYTLFPLPKGRLGVLNNNAYAFQVIEKDSLIVDYAPFDKIGSGAEIRWSPRNSKLQLAHELAHAYDANYGLVDDQLMQVNGEIMSAREVRALYHENIIRIEMNKRLRIDANTGKALIWEGTPYTYPLPVPARH